MVQRCWRDVHTVAAHGALKPAPAAGKVRRGPGKSPMKPPYLVFSDIDQTLINCTSVLDFPEYYFSGRYGSDGTEPGRRRFGRALPSWLIVACPGTRRAASTTGCGGGRACHRGVELGPAVVRAAQRGRGLLRGRRRVWGWSAIVRRARCSSWSVGSLRGGDRARRRDDRCSAPGVHAREDRCRPVYRYIDGGPVIGDGKVTAVRRLLAEYPWLTRPTASRTAITCRICRCWPKSATRSSSGTTRTCLNGCVAAEPRPGGTT